MANFLNRLAARAVGLAPVAQPVVPAMFSPGSGLETTGPPSEIVVERVVNPGERNFQSKTPATAVGASSPSERAGEATLPRDWETPAAQNAPFGLLDRTPAVPKQLSAQEHFSQPSAQTSSENVATRVLNPVTVIETAAGPDRVSHVIPEPDIIEGTKISQGAPVPPVFSPEITETRRQPASQAVVFGPTVSRDRRNASSANALVANATPEGPVIRVTIGRVDVRAQFSSPAPASTPARHARPAALSLDEYLKQRSEGRR